MSVTDWLNKGRPMIHDDNPPKAFPRTDAEFLADVAISALQDGRYELARELTRLAAQAKHMEMTAQPRMVPMIGRTRDETPTQPQDQDDASTEIIDAPVSARCQAQVYRDGVRDTCNAVIALRESDIGTKRFWAHLDPALDRDHVPLDPPF